MNKIHIALSTDNIEASVAEYSKRLNSQPVVVIPNEYALWRTESVNLSIRHDLQAKSGELRHLGWEDASAQTFSEETDINGIVWERFNAQNQADEINEIWPDTAYKIE